MPLPERSQLSLGDAAQHVKSKCSVSIEDARTSLAHAFYEYDLYPAGYDRSGNPAKIDWRAVRINNGIDWETSAVEWPSKASSGRRRVEDITLRRDLVEEWLRVVERRTNLIPIRRSARRTNLTLAPRKAMPWATTRRVRTNRAPELTFSKMARGRRCMTPRLTFQVNTSRRRRV